MTGHAGFSSGSGDIVCAAASVLATTCVNALETVAGVEPDVTVHHGYLKARIPAGLVPEQVHDVGVILRTYRQGIQDLAGSYGEYVTITNGGNAHDET